MEPGRPRDRSRGACDLCAVHPRFVRGASAICARCIRDLGAVYPRLVRGASATCARCIRDLGAVYPRLVRGASATCARCIRDLGAVYSRLVRGASATCARCIRDLCAVYPRLVRGGARCRGAGGRVPPADKSCPPGGPLWNGPWGGRAPCGQSSRSPNERLFVQVTPSCRGFVGVRAAAGAFAGMLAGMMRRGAVGVLACSAGLALSCGGRTTGSYPRDLDASSSRLVDSASSPADSATSGTTGGATGGTPGSAAPAGAVGRDGAAGAQGSDMTTAADDSGAASASAESGATGGDAGPGGETGCAASFEASFEHPCSGPVLPSSEQERVKARYVKSCENSLTFPGAASEMQLSACASVTLASDCRQTLNPWAIPECVFRGTLPKIGRAS